MRQYKLSTSKKVRRLSASPDDLIIIIDMGLVDAIRLHFKLKKHEALSKINEIIEKIDFKKGHKVVKKLKNKPISIVIVKAYYGNELTVTLESPAMVITLKQLHQYVSDKSIENMLFPSKRGKK